MTKVNFDARNEYEFTLNDLDTGDFFLDNEDHLCVFIERAIENTARYYDFHSQKIRCNRCEAKIKYLERVDISY